MKSKVLAALTLGLTLTLSAPVFAQDRHDVHQHGTEKSEAAAMDKGAKSAMPGAHDMHSHGAKKPTAEKDGAKKAAEPADKCCSK